MLKGIPSILTPELMKVLMEMGHGDEIVLANANFPAASKARRLVRCDGQGIAELLEAILRFFPLDSFVEAPVTMMKPVPGKEVPTPIWDVFHSIVDNYEPGANRFEHVDRFAFYERAEKAYAVVATGERAMYSNIILKKGIVVE